MGAIRELDNETGLVAFCFGIAHLPEIPGPGLVALLGVFGKSPAAARSLIARLQRRGVLAGRRCGRTTAYCLAGATVEQFTQVRNRGVGGEATSDGWDARFHGLLFHAPESHRAWRDQVRRVGISQGFRLLRPGLLVHPVRPVDAVLGHLAEPPPGASLLRVRLEFGVEEARGMVRQLWEVDALTDRVCAALNSLAELGAVPAELTRADVLRYAAAMRPAYQCLVLTPGLPPELLPPGWPMPQLHGALTGVNREWTPAVGDYARAVVTAASGPAAW